VEASLAELKEVDGALHTSLRWMLANPIDGILFESFAVDSGGGGEDGAGNTVVEEVELVPGGREVDVTDGNKLEYAELVLRWKLGKSGGASAAVEAIRGGLHELIPPGLLRDFTAADLVLALNGRNTINIEEIRPAAKYTGGFDEGSPTVRSVQRRRRRRRRCRRFYARMNHRSGTTRGRSLP